MTPNGSRIGRTGNPRVALTPREKTFRLMYPTLVRTVLPTWEKPAPVLLAGLCVCMKGIVMTGL